MMRKYLTYFLVIITAQAFAQAPVINNIQPLSAGANQKVVITGNGFDATPANNSVWFDHVAGKVTAATIYSLEVQVPAGSRFSNVEVINLTNNLSAKSQLKFLPSYGGVPFVVADTKLAKVDSSNVEFFDIASADFDLDGDADMVTSRGGPTSTSPITDIYVYSNTSTGIGTIKFTKTAWTVGAPTANVACGDLNGDGKPDIIASRGGTTRNEIFILKNTTTGVPNVSSGTISFAPKVVKTMDALQSAFRLTIRDLNGDGRPEIIASNATSTCTGTIAGATTSTTITGTGTLFLSELFVGSSLYNASGTFIGTVASIASNTSLTLTANAAVLVTNEAYSKSNQIYIFPNTSTVATISFGVAIKLNVIGALNTYGLEVQDLDGDTRPDIIVNQFQGPNIFIFRNISTGNIQFDPVSTPMASSANGSYNNIISSDLNGDGLLDLIATSTLKEQIQYWINNSTPGTISFDNANSKTLSSSVGPWGVDVSDIDGDGDADIIVANNSGPPPRYNPSDIKLNIFRQDSPLTFNRFDIAVANVQRNLRVGDYDGDSKPDIAFTSGVGTSFRVDVIRNKNCWAPTITGPSTKICAGQTIKLQTRPELGVNYDWKFNGATQSVNASTYNATGALGSGNYTVTLTGVADLNCVNTSPNYAITVDNASAFPSDPVISNNTPCLGTNLNLSTGSVATATYKWSGPNNFSATTVDPTTGVTIPSVTNSAAGVYSLQLTLANGCQSNVITKQLDVASVPVLPVTASPSAIGCVGGSINLSVSGSGYNFQWKKDGSTITTNSSANATLSLPSLSAANEGDYSVLVQSIANSCIQETAKTTVQVFTVPVANFSISSPNCKGAPITFTDLTTGADSRGGTLVYDWNFGDATAHSSLQTPPAHTYSTANTFSASLTVSYNFAGSCTPNSPKSIQVFDPIVPIIQSSANPICPGDQTTLSITNASSFSSIAWVGVTGSTSSVVINQPGDYHANTTDSNNCTASGLITVTSNPLITPFAITTSKGNPAQIKPGETLELVATAGGDTYSWTPTSGLSNAAISNPIASPTATTQYIVVATKAGFCNASDTILVTLEVGSAIINPPVLFSPNGDTHNDCWQLCHATCQPCVEETTYADWTMTIFDGHGSLVYQKKGFTGWDGGSAPDGVYYYVFSNSHGKPTTGSVLLVRQKQ